MIVRGVVKKQKSKSFYKVTEKGWKWLWVAISSKRYFENPIISKIYKKEVSKTVEQPSNFEKSYDLINQGLCLVTRELALI